MAAPKKKARQSETLCLTLTKSKDTILTTPTFTEAIDAALLKRLIGSGLLITERNHKIAGIRMDFSEHTLMTKILGKVKNNILTVKYSRHKSGWGRVSPKHFHSLGVMRKEVRHTLCGADWWDFDVANCHPAIVLQLCQSNGILCIALEHYVSNREECLAEVVAALFVSGADPEAARDAAKVLFIRVMYGGSPKKWIEDARKPEWDHKVELVANPVIPACVSALTGEMKTISKRIQDANPAMVKDIRDYQKAKGKTTNWDGSFLSIYAQEWERRVLECVLTMMVGKGYITKEAMDSVLAYDGLQTRRANMMATDVATVLRECETVVLDKMGLSLTFTEKAMTKSLLPQIEAAEKEALNFVFPEDKMMWIDTKFMINSLPTYKHKKAYFEVFVAKVMMTTEHMWCRKQIKTDAYGFDTVDYVLESFDDNRLAKALKHVGSGNFNQHGNETRFVEEWLKDGDMRVFNHVEFVPYNGVFDPKQDQVKLGPTVYNDFKGYNSHIKAPLRYDTKVYRNHVLREFFALGKSIFEDKLSFFEYYLKCVAFKIQYPAKKHPYLFLLIGKEGTGKTMLMDAIGRVFGEHHFYSTTNPEDLFGTHAEGFVGKLWVNLNEVNGASTMGIQSKVKGAVSEDEMTVNAKYVRPRRAKNYAFMTWITNNYNSFKMEAAARERRNVVAKGTDKYLTRWYNEQFWTRLNDHFRSPEFIRCLYDYLNGMDLTGIDWKQLRRDNLTSSYYDLAAQNAPIEAVFFEQVCQKIKCGEMTWQYMPEPIYKSRLVEWNKPIRFLTRDLHAKCVDWAVDKNHYQKSQPSQAKFVGQCKHLDLPLTQKNPLSGGLPTWGFVPRTLHEHIVERKWIEEDEVDEGESDDDTDVNSFCRKMVDDILVNAVHKCEITDRFTFKP